MLPSITKPVLALLLSVASAAAWASHVEATALTFDSSWTNTSLLSDSGSTIRISLADYGSLQASASDPGHPSDVRGFWDLFTVNVRPGYQVTGLSLSATYSGNLNPFIGPPGDPSYINGKAENWGALSMQIGTLSEPNDAYGRFGIDISNVHGSRSVNNAIALALDGTFALFPEGYVEAYAEAGATNYGGGRWYSMPSSATLRLLDPVLTIHTSPVPEPGSWAMLLAGVGALGVLRRAAAKRPA